MRIRGVAHVHSSLSFDGRLDFDRLAGFLAERGIQFALLSEHVETLNPLKLQELVRECARVSTDSLLLIPGLEIDALNALFYGVPAVERWSDNCDLARQLAAGGALVVVSHPVKISGDVPEITGRFAEAVEIWNTRHDGRLALNPAIVRFWQSLEQRLQRSLLPVCGIDFHAPRDFTAVGFELDCASLESNEVLQALRSRRYTIVRGRRTLPLDMVDGTLTLSYRSLAVLYRMCFDAAHVLHRAALRGGVRLPSFLKAPLRRLFLINA